MPRHTRITLFGIAVLTLAVVGGLTAQSAAPQADPMLAELRAMRADIHAQNEFLRGFTIGLDGLANRECIVAFHSALRSLFKTLPSRF